MNYLNHINTIKTIAKHTKIYLVELAMTHPRKLIGLTATFSFLAGSTTTAFISYKFYQYYHRTEFTSTFSSIEEYHNGPIAGQIDHILKPKFILKKDNINVYVKKLRYNAIALTGEEWNRYRQNRRAYYESKGFKKESIDKYETLNYHLIDFNSKFLTRLLFKEENVVLPHDKYYNSPQITPLELEYEKILKKIIENGLLVKPN
jgi:hypothetical protein